MAVPSTIDEFLELVRKSTVVDEKRLDAYLEKQRTQGNLPTEVGKYAGVLVRDGVLTQFQAEQILLGKWRRFSIGKYKVLERIGSGGMGSVYLCEHKLMRRRVAIKVLPTAKAEEPSALERFQREARVVAALDHPNIVRAYDIDQEDKLHFLVMEYIDGSSLQEIVKRHGPLSIARASHYIRQAAAGLHHAYQVAHIVHRDIKPGNILVDRQGVVKILDMGLARFFHDEEEILTRKYDENVLGTADYLAPEQALDSHDVDIRADLYSLGATFYFCLTGNTPFNEGTVAQKLIWHQTRQPKPVRSLRPEVPEGIAAVIEKLMAKDREQRYQTPAEVVEALAAWTQVPIEPPPEKEMPRLSPAASGAVCFGEPSLATPTVPASASPSSIARRWAAVKTSTTPPPATPAPGANPSPTRPKPPSSAVLPPDTPHPRGQTSARVARPAPAADTVAAESENISWEKLAPDTADVTAHLDTAPHSAPKRRPLSSAVHRRQPPPKDWRLIAAAVAGGAVLLFLLAWWAFNRRPPQSEPAARPSREPNVLQVSRSTTNRPNSFKTIREALAQAREGDRVVVQDDQIEETLSLENGRLGKGVTIEGANPQKRVLWSFPDDAKESRFVALSNVQGLRLKGFTIDGKNKVRDLITVQGNCPGLVFENLELRGFSQNGVVFWNCGGDSEQGPVKLSQVRFLSAPDTESALLFQARENVSPPFNHNLLVSDCRFEGPCKAVVQLASSVRDLALRRNRVFKANDGILYLKATPRYQIQLTLDSNTFYGGKTALRFESLPQTSANDSLVVVKNNLFGKTPVVAKLDDKQRRAEVGLIFQFSRNVRDPECKEGDIPLGTASLPFTLATKPEDNTTFLRYRKTDRLAQAGLDLKPVGVPPAD